MEQRKFAIGMTAVLLLAVILRLHGIHNPILDHPNWRQGDTAAIARNFAELRYNVLYPQTNYNGPPPNYVELELQIVPFLAATLYKIFGVHEIFGRLITLCFSVATVGVLGLFGRWLFGSWIAGLSAAFAYAVFPGSVYYGRTFTPDATMVFFLTAALYTTARFIFEDPQMQPRNLARVTALIAFAYLAKPVAVAGIVPIIAMLWERAKGTQEADAQTEYPPMRATAVTVLLFVPLLILYLYQRNVAAHAEWHWASGITTLHVIPAMQSALTSVSGFVLKLQQFNLALHMLAKTMLGHVGTILALLGVAVTLYMALKPSPEVLVRSKTLLWGWLIGGLAYTYVVVTAERVDYYMFLLLPLAALFMAGLVAYAVPRLQSLAATSARNDIGGNALVSIGGAVIVIILAGWMIRDGRAAVRPYYAFNKQAYRNAITLSHTLDATTPSQALDSHALVVMGHYGPDVLYYMHRYGWEEDPLAWTPFDEESAIKKGARYYISIEDNRLHKNVELCAWLQRFPVINADAQWPVYQTDPSKILPGADSFWKQFRSAERAGQARQFLDQHNLCQR